MLACAQDAGDEISRRWFSTSLRTVAPVEFTGDGTTTVFTLPGDFKAFPFGGTFISSAYPTMTMPGPVNDDDLLKMKALPMSVYPSAWRRLGNSIEFYPVPQTGEKITYSYGKSSWITDSSGTPYTPAVWKADTDLSVIPDELIRMGVIWRWKAAKGLEYGEEKAQFESALHDIAGQDLSEKTIYLSKIPYNDSDIAYPATITFL
jgi:hypothetical protein